MNKLLKLSIKTTLYFFVIIFILVGLFFTYYFIKGGINKESIITFKAMYLSKKEKCYDLTIDDINILNKSFENIGYSGGIDYWCNLEVINFFQAKEDYQNKLNGKETFKNSVNIPAQIGKLNNLYDLTLVNIKIDGMIPVEFGYLKKLVRLEINGTGIEKLPKEIENLKNLKILYIDEYLYKNLPDKISEKIKNKEIIDYYYYTEN